MQMGPAYSLNTSYGETVVVYGIFRAPYRNLPLAAVRARVQYRFLQGSKSCRPLRFIAQPILVIIFCLHVCMCRQMYSYC